MKYEQCKKCKYLQLRVNYDNGYGISYYGCAYPPYWGKVIESIFVCPRLEAEKMKKVNRR